MVMGLVGEEGEAVGRVGNGLACEACGGRLIVLYYASV